MSEKAVAQCTLHNYAHPAVIGSAKFKKGEVYLLQFRKGRVSKRFGAHPLVLESAGAHPAVAGADAL